MSVRGAMMTTLTWVVCTATLLWWMQLVVVLARHKLFITSETQYV
jgi:hypothetical protein